MTPTDPDQLFDDAFWQRLENHERPQLYEYLQIVSADPEAICHAFNPSHRQEFVRLLLKAPDLSSPRI